MSDAGDPEADANSQNGEQVPEEDPEEKLPEVNIEEETKKVPQTPLTLGPRNRQGRSITVEQNG
jgi:hypothetical protein